MEEKYKPGQLFKYPTKRGNVVKILGVFQYHPAKEKAYYRVHYINDKSRPFIIPHSKAEKLFKPIHLKVIE